MAETPPSRDELDLRRRARRRLVGAIALALMAVVVLPMVFDPEPRPLGDKVEIRIPDQATPFQSAPVPAPQAPAAPVPSEAADGDAADADGDAADAKVETSPPAKPAPAEKPAAKPAPATKSVAEPSTKPAAKPREAKPTVAAKPETPAKPASAAKPEASQPAPAGKPAAAYFLQLGVFSSAANASQMIAKAKVAGFKAASVAVGAQHKVRVGPIADRNKALDYQTKLKARGLDAVLVEP